MVKKMEAKDIVVYVAGPLSDNECGYLQNVSRNLQTAKSIKELGYSVIAPSCDLLLGLQAGNYEYYDYADNSLAIMKKCDILFLDIGWENSKGCLNEKKVANELGIPIAKAYYEIDIIALDLGMDDIERRFGE